MTKGFKEKLKKLGVATIFLFGSRATDTASPLSDRDIGVLLKVPPPETERPNFYLPFYELFTDLFPDSRVDIVILQTAPLSIQFAAVKEGEILFEDDPILTADYVHQVINRYLDFRYVLDDFDRVTIEKYASA